MSGNGGVPWLNPTWLRILCVCFVLFLSFSFSLFVLPPSGLRLERSSEPMSMCLRDPHDHAKKPRSTTQHPERLLRVTSKDKLGTPPETHHRTARRGRSGGAREMKVHSEPPAGEFRRRLSLTVGRPSYPGAHLPHSRKCFPRMVHHRFRQRQRVNVGVVSFGQDSCRRHGQHGLSWRPTRNQQGIQQCQSNQRDEGRQPSCSGDTALAGLLLNKECPTSPCLADRRVAFSRSSRRRRSLLGLGNPSTHQTALQRIRWRLFLTGAKAETHGQPDRRTGSGRSRPLV